MKLLLWASKSCIFSYLFCQMIVFHCWLWHRNLYFLLPFSTIGCQILKLTMVKKCSCPFLFFTMYCSFVIYHWPAYLPKRFLLLTMSKQNIVKIALWWRKTSQSVREQHLCKSYSHFQENLLIFMWMKCNMLSLKWWCLGSEVAGIIACRWGGNGFDCWAISVRM